MVETRLLVLCAGAIGTNSSLKAVVFLGRSNNKERVFLGWAAPAQLLAALMNANPEYRIRLTKVRMIVQQLSMFGGSQLRLQE